MAVEYIKFDEEEPLLEAAPWIVHGMLGLMQSFDESLSKFETPEEEFRRRLAEYSVVLLAIDFSLGHTPESVIGFGALDKDSIDRMWLSSSFVRPGYRGKGHWSKMVDMRVEEARERGEPSARVLTFTDFLVQSLIKRGFVEVLDDYLELELGLSET